MSLKYKVYFYSTIKKYLKQLCAHKLDTLDEMKQFLERQSIKTHFMEWTGLYY